MELRSERRYQGRGGSGGTRGDVRGFSRKSRKRLLRKMAGLRKGQVAEGLFVTLTYPAEYPDCVQAKRHLQAWLKRLQRRYPRVAVVWRLELQKRGAPHFHLVVLGLRYLPSEWVARSWYEVVGSGDARHLQAGTEVRRVKGYAHAVYYCGKYLAKSDSQDADIVGRSWGVCGRADLYLSPVAVYRLTRDQALTFGEFLTCLRGRSTDIPHFGSVFWFAGGPECAAYLDDVAARAGEDQDRETDRCRQESTGPDERGS